MIIIGEVRSYLLIYIYTYLEWALFAIHNACKNCTRNQSILSSLQQSPASVANYDVGGGEGEGRPVDVIFFDSIVPLYFFSAYPSSPSHVRL